MRATNLILVSSLVTTCFAVFFDVDTNTNKLNVSIGFVSNPVVDFFNLLDVAFNRFQNLVTQLTADANIATNASVGLFIGTLNSTFDLVKGATIRTVEDFVSKAKELRGSLTTAISSGWNLAKSLFLNGEYLLALPVTAFTIFLKTLWGILTAIRLNVGLELGGSTNSSDLS